MIGLTKLDGSIVAERMLGANDTCPTLTCQFVDSPDPSFAILERSGVTVGISVHEAAVGVASQLTLSAS
jgi:hypothetical protein